jgi:hypothetical protein
MNDYKLDIPKGYPIPWEEMTKVKGDPMCHIEQLWDEVSKLREEIRILKEKNV